VRGTWRSHARIAALALFFLAAAGAARTALAATQILVGVDKVRFAWTPPSGSATGYSVSRSLNGAAFQAYAYSSAPNIDVPVKTGDQLMITVAGIGYDSSGALVAGPQSVASDRVYVQAAPRFPVNGLWLLRCGTCPALALRSLGDASLVQAQNTGPSSSWRVLGNMMLRSGLHEIVFQDTTTGQLALWDRQVLAPLRGAVGTTTLNVRGVGSADLDGDGGEEFVMQRTDTLQASIWSATSSGFVSVGTLPGPPGALLAAVRDLDGDGQPETLWQDPVAGTLYSLSPKANPLLSLPFLSLYQFPATLLASSLAADATVASTGDYDGDGNLDLLLRYASGKLVVVYLVAGKPKGSRALPALAGDVDLSVVGSVDFDGISGDEIALQHRTTRAITLLDPKQTTAVRVTVLTPGSTWKVIGIEG
jgi:hypothetical protein